MFKETNLFKPKIPSGTAPSTASSVSSTATVSKESEDKKEEALPEEKFYTGSLDLIEDIKKSEYYTIYVPQGHSGQLLSESKSHKIRGLYTDSFSNCNIIIARNSGYVVLIHADLDAINTIDQIKSEIRSFSRDQISMVTRNKDAEMAKFIVRELKILPKNILTVNLEKDGVYLSFSQFEMLKRGQHPHGLIHHPDERRLLSVRKIEQLIGMAAKIEKEKVRKKYLNLFDGRFWQLFLSELKIDNSHTKTQAELKEFKETDTHDDIYGKLLKIAESLQKSIKQYNGVSLEDIVNDVIFYFEDYHHNFSKSDSVFKTNLLSAIQKNKERRGSLDETYIEKITGYAAATGNFDRLLIEIEEYRTKGTDTPFKQSFFEVYDPLYSEYQRLDFYEKYRTFHQAQFANIVKIFNAADQAWISKNFAAAAELYQDFIMKCSPFCLENAKEIRKAYFKRGVSLLGSKKYEDAHASLQVSLDLLNLVQPPDESERTLILKKMEAVKEEMSRIDAEENVLKCGSK